MRMAIAILATLAIWFPLGAFIGSRYTPTPRLPGAFSVIGIEAPTANGGVLFVSRVHPFSGRAHPPARPARAPPPLFGNTPPPRPPPTPPPDLPAPAGGRV